MDLSIIIVSWNVRDLLEQNLKKIYQNTKNINFEIFVVDNNSADETVRSVEENFPQVNLIVNNYNAGFAKANNQAISRSKGRYILLLNPDMLVLPGTLERMVKWMDRHRDAAVAGCHLIDGGGKTVSHIRRFPKLWDQLMIVLKVPHVLPFVLDKYLMKDFDYAKEAPVDSIRGSFFVIRREALNVIGKLDERYFIWFEEVDYCRQVKKAGLRVFYTPAAQCIDYVGKSFSQVGRGKTQQYFRDSMLKYFKKWHPAWQYWILKAAWPIGMIAANFKKDKKSSV